MTINYSSFFPWGKAYSALYQARPDGRSVRHRAAWYQPWVFGERDLRQIQLCHPSCFVSFAWIWVAHISFQWDPTHPRRSGDDNCVHFMHFLYIFPLDNAVNRVFIAWLPHLLPFHIALAQWQQRLDRFSAICMHKPGECFQLVH